MLSPQRRRIAVQTCVSPNRIISDCPWNERESALAMTSGPIPAMSPNVIPIRLGCFLEHLDIGFISQFVDPFLAQFFSTVKVDFVFATFAHGDVVGVFLVE